MSILRRSVQLAAAAALSVALHQSAQAQQVQVALGDTISVETLAMVVALERAKARGFDYKLTSFAKEDLAIQAVVAGQADIGIATPFSVMQKTKAPLRGLMQLTRLVFFPVADKSIKDWQAVNGQPFTFHARGSGTEAIGNILAKRYNISYGQRNYISGSDNRVVAMMNGQIKATILDLANKNILLQKAGDRFHVLPGIDNPASDEILFVRTDWMDKNGAKADLLVEEFYKLWSEMAKNPAIVEQERAKRNLLKDLPKEVVDGVTKFYTQGVQEGVFSKNGGGPEAAKADFEFFVEAGQLTGPAGSLKVEDFWNFGPLNKARQKIGRHCAMVVDTKASDHAAPLAVPQPSLGRRVLEHPLGARLISFAVVLLAWEYAGRKPISPAFPSLTETLAAAAEMIADLSLPNALVITMVPLVIGVTISAIAGISAGIAMGLSRRAEWLGVPIFVVLQAAPLAALIPLLVLAYGVGLASKVSTVCIMAMPVIVLNSFKAIRHAPVSLVEMGQSFLGSRGQIIGKIILPAASPVIFAGLRLGLAAGFIGAVLSELLISPTGIGDLITYHQSIADYPKMFAAIVTIILLSVVFIDLLDRAEVALFRPERRNRA
jgi:NitT/TauT family transport system substrate-binding protein